MLYDGFRMSADEGAEELEEVQATLRRRDDDNNDVRKYDSIIYLWKCDLFFINIGLSCFCFRLRAKA